MAYMLVIEGALAGGWTIPWIRPARPPHDLGTTFCPTIAFAAGTAMITVRGGRERVSG
jgi:hypothetical protein